MDSKKNKLFAFEIDLKPLDGKRCVSIEYQEVLFLNMKSSLPDFPVFQPLEIRMNFVFERPREHYTIRKNQLKNTAPKWHTNKVPLQGMINSVLNALTYRQSDRFNVKTGEYTYKTFLLDQSNVMKVCAEKMWGPKDKVFIEIIDLSHDKG